MKSIKFMTSEQLHWLYMLNDDDYYHFDPWKHPIGLGSAWMDTLAHRIADAAGGYAKLNFDPAKTFTPDPKLLAMGYLNWSKNPSFPPKAWEQMAMSWGRSYSSMPLFKDYLQQRLDIGSFIIPRHKSCPYTFSNSKSATPSNLNKLINDIASNPYDFWVIFDPKEAYAVESNFKNDIFKNWCELTQYINGRSHFTSGMWGTFPLFNFPTSGTDLFRALNDPINGKQILAQGFLYAFYG